MSTDQTPALARTVREMRERFGAEWMTPDDARAVVSAALHDPSVKRRVRDALYTVPADDLLDKQPGETYYDHAERIAAWAVGAVSAAILGEVA